MNVYWNVAPRYTPGSPAQVDEKTARRVMNEERRGYKVAVSGTYGEAEAERAAAHGLFWIVWTSFEIGNRYIKTDEMTGEREVFKVNRDGREMTLLKGASATATKEKKRYCPKCSTALSPGGRCFSDECFDIWETK